MPCSTKEPVWKEELKLLVRADPGETQEYLKVGAEKACKSIERSDGKAARVRTYLKVRVEKACKSLERSGGRAERVRKYLKVRAGEAERVCKRTQS